MLVLNEEETRRAMPWEQLIAALGSMFRSNCVAPVRHHHRVDVPGEQDATLLLMPAWIPGGFSGVKIVSVFPDNASRSLPAIHGSYFLSSAQTGAPLAIVDGGELTARRTAAASALAAKHLAREDSSALLVCGTGRLALNLIEAHATVRPIKSVRIWGRNRTRATAIARGAQALGFDAQVAEDLAEAVGHADIVSCATLSTTPIIRGQWLKPGAHLDLIGAFTAEMRESDDEAVLRSMVYVDTRGGALSEAGDLVQPIRAGLFQPSDICGDLKDLETGTVHGRQDNSDITLFKSVGAALEDLAGAVLAYQNSVKSAAT